MSEKLTQRLVTKTNVVRANFNPKPLADDNPRCAATKPDGRPCTAPATYHGVVCKNHVSRVPVLIELARRRLFHVYPGLINVLWDIASAEMEERSVRVSAAKALLTHLNSYKLADDRKVIAEGPHKGKKLSDLTDVEFFEERVRTSRVGNQEREENKELWRDRFHAKLAELEREGKADTDEYRSIKDGLDNFDAALKTLEP